MKKSEEKQQDVLKETRRIAVDTLAAYPVKIYLFGSWARGTPSESSDIDLAIDSETPLPAGILSTLRERLEESTIPWRVEVVDLRNAASSFRERVLHEGILWKD